MDAWLQAAQLLGVPTVILAAVGMGFVRVCYWLAPRVDRLVLGHHQLLEKTTEIQAQIKSLVEALGRRVDEHTQLEFARLEAIQTGIARLERGRDDGPGPRHAA